MHSTRAYGEDEPYVKSPITAGINGFEGAGALDASAFAVEAVEGGEYGLTIDRSGDSDVCRCPTVELDCWV